MENGRSPNVMIKVPGTAEGIPAFEQLISEGININVTLLFSQEVYQKVAKPTSRGLEQVRCRAAEIVSHIASVASFFISRIDNPDRCADLSRLKTEKNPQRRAKLKALLGKVAIANGKLTYQRYLKIFSDAALGAACSQRRANTARTLGQHQHQESRLS